MILPAKYLIQRTKFVFCYADLVCFRLLLGTASIVYAGLVLANPLGFHRPLYDMMVSIFSWWGWTILFTLHGVGAYWRIFAIKDRPNWALAINFLGFFVWSLSTVCINWTLGTYMPSSAMEWVMCCFSAWALFRTGSTKEILPS